METLKRIIFVLAMASVTIAATSPPATMFTWTNPTQDMSGSAITITSNKISCGTTPNNYTIHHITTSAVTQINIAQVVTELGAYYCAVTASTFALDGTVKESGYSNEVFLELLDPNLLAPAVPVNFGVR